ncbi:hypothetical protein CsatA_005865 [Cannabis sativa]
MADDGDRISKLPDTVILHMLSLLPTKDVVRTCLLSKRWKLLWYSVPTISFSYADFKCSHQFSNYVSQYLKHRKKGMYFIVDSVLTSFKLDMFLISFKLDMFDYNKRCVDDILDQWLSFVVENKVKEIYLNIRPDTYEDTDEDGDVGHSDLCYCLPKVLFDNATYLTILNLEWLKVDASYSFSFPSLKSLSLKGVVSDTSKDDVVFKFLLGCPSLEKLCLSYYEFLCIDNAPPLLQSLSLKFLEFDDVQINFTLQVDTTNLESLVLGWVNLDKIDLFACKKIRNLSLISCRKDYQPSLEGLIFGIPHLENLTLKECRSSLDYHLRISSQQLKSFTFEEPSLSCKLSHVEIESAPRLEYFYYEGGINFSISMESSNSINGKIVINEKENQSGYDTKWFADMINFLVNLKCSWNIVTLHVSTHEALIWPENLKKICRYPALNWRHLKIITHHQQPQKDSELKDALMWISPSLETLSINKKVIF